MNRTQKKINIILIYLLFIVAFFGVIYFMTKPEMTCTDGIKNQGEEEVDCGGPCKICAEKRQINNLEIKSIERAKDNKSSEDILIKIHNPNKEYGAKSFTINISSKSDRIGKVYKEFILPKETKYIIINHYTAEDKEEKLNISINENDIDWIKMINYQTPKLVVYNDKYQLEVLGNMYAYLTGTLANKGTVDYETIKVKGVLRDVNGVFISATSHIINTLSAGSQREFRLSFPRELVDIVAQQEIEVETNIFNTDNYLKTKGEKNYIDQ